MSILAEYECVELIEWKKRTIAVRKLPSISICRFGHYYLILSESQPPQEHGTKIKISCRKRLFPKMSVSTLRSLEYLEQLPGTTFNRLYQQPSTALAVFRRFLPHLAKTFVMQMLFLSEPTPVEDLENRVRPDSVRYVLTDAAA